ncbi:hypothetical protein ACS34L_17065, partial [Bacillus altitudinis]
LKKIVGSSLKTHCQHLKEDTKHASDFSSAQQVVAEVYVALLSSFEGKALEAICFSVLKKRISVPIENVL